MSSLVRRFVPRRIRWVGVAVFLTAITRLGGESFDVGPGQSHPTPSDVPWETLNAGDVVRIHWRPEPYRDKWVICRKGKASAPIIVRGEPGPRGQRPVIDGRDARTRRSLDFWGEDRCVIKVGGASYPTDLTPSYIVIEGLEIRSARPPFGFVDDTGHQRDYVAHASAIYVEKGDHITVRDCLIHDCGNGFFTAADSENILVEANEILGNGIEGSHLEHNSYTSASGIIFQYNHFGPLRDGCLGSNVKDRSAGTVVRYNWIEGGNLQLTLVDASNSMKVQQDPRYRTAYVYGNVLIEPEAAGSNQVVAYGGDMGDPRAYRKGTLYFYNNTVISERGRAVTLFRLATDEETVNCFNNVFYTVAAGHRVAVLASGGVASLSHNWFKPGYVRSHSRGVSGQVIDQGTNVLGQSPGFVDFERHDFRLAAMSVCRNRASVLPEAVADHAPREQYVLHRKKKARRSSRMPFDLGAFEYSRDSGTHSGKSGGGR